MNKLNEVLKSELIESVGCTEPSAISLAVAYAKESLNTDEDIESVCLALSSNVLKNALCVTIPNTNASGIEMIVALSLNKCKSDNHLTILNNITKEEIDLAVETLKNVKINIELIDNCDPLYICVEIKTKNHKVKVEIENKHDEIKSCEKDGVVVFKNNRETTNQYHANKFTYDEVFDFIQNGQMDIDLLKTIKKYNLEIANYGIENQTGLGVGKAISGATLFDEKYRSVIAKTVAGVDSRMSGVSKKVYINSGSGNQGITATVPVVELAKILNVSEEEELKALALSHLTAIFIRSKQGRLSSSCGAVCASGGATAGMAYLLGATREQIEGAVLNLLCSNFGVFCDGAKTTCALKVASAISSALTSAFLAKENVFINANLGVVSKSLEETLNSLSVIENKMTSSMDKTILEVAMKNVKK